ncbi:MAG: hypothetical protein ACRDPM_05490, partial [Solirubrobacteraceae bacterium]
SAVTCATIAAGLALVRIADPWCVSSIDVAGEPRNDPLAKPASFALSEVVTSLLHTAAEL